MPGKSKGHTRVCPPAAPSSAARPVIITLQVLRQKVLDQQTAPPPALALRPQDRPEVPPRGSLHTLAPQPEAFPPGVPRRQAPPSGSPSGSPLSWAPKEEPFPPSAQYSPPCLRPAVSRPPPPSWRTPPASRLASSGPRPRSSAACSCLVLSFYLVGYRLWFNPAVSPRTAARRPRGSLRPANRIYLSH